MQHQLLAREHPILTAAIEYARLGYRVIPLKPGTKVPDLRHWPEEASNDPEVVSAHFDASYERARGASEPNVGIVTGHGLAVLDVDTNHGGVVPEWAMPTLRVRTPSGGLHLYYAVDGPVPNSVGRLGRGIDVRGERGQVAAPPSLIRLDGYKLYPDGARFDERHLGSPFRDRRAQKTAVYDFGAYTLLDDRPIEKLNANFLIPEDERQDFFGRTARKFEYRDEVPVGERNNYLTSMAGYLFANGDSPAEVRQALQMESDGLGFTPRDGELASIVRSVGRYH